MQFEHLIEINDPRHPTLPRLSAAQVWRGLLLKVQHPDWFVDALERADVTELPDGQFDRVLHFGAFQVCDRVVLGDALQISACISHPQNLAGSRLEISLEAPAAGVLVVRFRYSSPEGGLGANLTGPERRAMESAWLHADRDAIALIRSLAAEGRLGI